MIIFFRLFFIQYTFFIVLRKLANWFLKAFKNSNIKILGTVTVILTLNLNLNSLFNQENTV